MFCNLDSAWRSWHPVDEDQRHAVFTEGHRIELKNLEHIHQVSERLWSCSVASWLGAWHAGGAAAACGNVQKLQRESTELSVHKSDSVTR